MKRRGFIALIGVAAAAPPGPIVPARRHKPAIRRRIAIPRRHVARTDEASE